MKRLLLTLAILFGVAGAGHATGGYLAGEVADVVGPQPAAAACSIQALSIYRSGPDVYARGAISGCGSGRYVQICVQYSNLSTAGCRGYYTNGGSQTFWSDPAFLLNGQRSRFAVSGYGVYYGSWY